MYLNWSPAPTSLKGMPTKGVCREQSYDLIAGQTINVGDMMVSNDDEFLYVTYQTEGGWMLKEIHLFVGPLEFFPVNKKKIPVPGHFPIKEYYSPPEELVTFAIALSEIPECPLIAAHAVVVKDDMEETAWGFGTSFDDFFPNVKVNRWGWVIDDYCIEECEEELILAVKSWLLEPYACDEGTCYNSFWAVSSGESISSTGWCSILGINYLNIGDIYALNSYLGPQIGNISVSDSTATDGSYYLIIKVNLNEGSTLTLTKSYLYVGSRDGFDSYHQGDCPSYWMWPFSVEEQSNSHTFIIPYNEIND